MEAIEGKRDIWSEGIRSIMSSAKRSLLDYVDAIKTQNSSIQENERLEKIKARVHNDISQASFNMFVLITALRNNGDISAFANDLDRKSKVMNKFNRLLKQANETNNK